MRKLLLIAAVSATLVFLGVANASAGHRGCGGRGHHGGCGSGGCGSGGCGSGGYGYGGCGSGGCGSGGGSYGYAGCSTCGSSGYSGMAAAAPYCTGPYCSGGYAATGGYVPFKALAAAERQEATLLVSLPENATLVIDDYQTKSTSANRVFRTPALETGKDFHYTLKAQVPTADGKMETITKEVTVRAGESTRVSIEVPSAAVAAK
jgi:uncharacterized protein (TIGR03000 family)